MSELPWFTLKTTAPTDPKWLSYARRANQPVERVFHVFCVLMAEARKSDDPGNVEHFDPEPIADYLRCEIEDIEAIYEALCQPLKRRGPVVEDGKIRNFDRHQPGRVDPTVNERMKRYRDKKKKEKQEDRDSNGNATDEEVTQCYVTVTSRGEESREDSESSSRNPRSTMSRARKIDDEDNLPSAVSEIFVEGESGVSGEAVQALVSDQRVHMAGNFDARVRSQIRSWVDCLGSPAECERIIWAGLAPKITNPISYISRIVGRQACNIVEAVERGRRPEESLLSVFSETTHRTSPWANIEHEDDHGIPLLN